MRSIKLNGKKIVAVHVLTKVTDGNMVPYSERKEVTVFDGIDEMVIPYDQYQQNIVGSGIRKYSGTVESGGGRHVFYGVDKETAKKYLADELANYNNNK